MAKTSHAQVTNEVQLRDSAAKFALLYFLCDFSFWADWFEYSHLYL